MSSKLTLGLGMAVEVLRPAESESYLPTVLYSGFSRERLPTMAYEPTGFARRIAICFDRPLGRFRSATGLEWFGVEPQWFGHFPGTFAEWLSVT